MIPQFINSAIYSCREKLVKAHKYSTFHKKKKKTEKCHFHFCQKMKLLTSWFFGSFTGFLVCQFSKYFSRFLEKFAYDNRSQPFHLPLIYIRLVPRNESNAQTGSYLDRCHGGMEKLYFCQFSPGYCIILL